MPRKKKKSLGDFWHPRIVNAWITGIPTKYHLQILRKGKIGFPASVLKVWLTI